MDRFTRTGAALVLLVGLLAATVSAAQPPGGPPLGGPGKGGGPERFLDMHADELGLDEATREAIREIIDASRDDAEDLRADLHDLHQEMKDLLETDAPDEAAVMRQAEAIGALETEMHKHRLATLLAIRALLTPQQRETLMQIREERREERFQPVFEACEADRKRLCPGADDRRSRRRCMREHRDELSEECRASLEGLPRRGPGRRGGGGVGGGVPGGSGPPLD
ncbi:MAG: Spy/CpxP family protein refolding chaperone [Deltaproteobacteria bacterium]|nr:MAG: Spy/CpxP family protein refolding chaperone [Deltaproteobacteria bacterium]